MRDWLRFDPATLLATVLAGLLPSILLIAISLVYINSMSAPLDELFTEPHRRRLRERCDLLEREVERRTTMLRRAIERILEGDEPDVTGNDLRDLKASAQLGMKLRKLGKRDVLEVMRILPMSVYELLGDWFESDVVKGAVAASAVGGLCQGPMGGGTVYTLLYHHV